MAITLNLNDDLIRQAEALARQQGRSLTTLLEDYLREVVRRSVAAEPALSPSVQALFGVLPLPPDFDYKTQRDRDAV